MTQVKLDKKEIERSISFYKGQGVQNVLKRFDFTKEERKKINDAIRTSKLPNPRVKLIYEVDELLKEIAKTRKPKQVEIDSVYIPVEVNLKLASMESEKNKDKIKLEKIFVWLISIILLLVFAYVQNNNNKKIEQILQPQQIEQTEQTNKGSVLF